MLQEVELLSEWSPEGDRLFLSLPGDRRFMPPSGDRRFSCPDRRSPVLRSSVRDRRFKVGDRRFLLRPPVLLHFFYFRKILQTFDLVMY